MVQEIKISVHGILLAAGGSNRMNGKFPKLTLPFRQNSLLWWSLKAALESKLKSVILVVGANSNKVLYGIKNSGGGKKLDIIVNDEWEKGRSTSVSNGIEALKNKYGHVMFLQGDQPLMTTKLINSLIELTGKNPESPMIYPVINGEKANPVVYSKEGIKELLKIGGDVSGYGLTEKFKGRTVTLELEDVSTQFNVNTNSDYRRLIEEHEIV